MSNIGYAVFGTPKGFEIESNGLFKELDLDKYLYLNNAHVILSKGDKLIMLHRFASDLNNKEKLDGLIIALYEFALPQGNDRPGSFIGSAICIKEYQVNVPTLFGGLAELLKNIKDYIDTNSRFLDSDKDSWKMNLPSYQQDFGIQNQERITYIPSNTPQSDNVVQVHKLLEDGQSLINHFILNASFHQVKTLYIVNDANLGNQIQQKGLKEISFASFFNYDKFIKLLNTTVTKKEQEVKVLEVQKSDLNCRILSLDNQIRNKQQELTKLVSDLDKINNDYKLVGDKKLEIEKISTKLHDLDLQKRKLEQFLQQNNSDNNNKNQFKIHELEVKLNNERKESRQIFLSLLGLAVSFLIGMIIFLILWYKAPTKKEFLELKQQLQAQNTEPNQNIDNSSVDLDLEKLYAELAGFNVSDLSNLSTHQKNVNNLFNKILNNKIQKDDKLYELAISRHWQFWELHFEGKNLILNLQNVYKKALKDKDDIDEDGYQFILSHSPEDIAKNFPNAKNYLNKYLEVRKNNYFYVEMDINDFKPQWQTKPNMPFGAVEADKAFKMYYTDVNDLYQILDKDLSEDILRIHFEWMVKELNPEANLKSVGTIRIPFIK